ncbi:MAG TPA: substrate-binding domain-containing protein, partial [Fodinibius sp.]|nr:substrate-binding domain-containing protein [Fodinibius sp.]
QADWLFAQHTRDYENRYDPPWQSTELEGTSFSVLGIDNLPDFHGDVNNPDLVIFFAGNQYMVVPELLAAFKEEYPEYQRVFAETIPPGLEGNQVEEGALVIGNMRISLQPDIVTAGKGRMQERSDKDWLSSMKPYAKNKLAIMVPNGNPLKIAGLQDLAKPTVKVAMPNPEWEGIGERIVKAYRNAGGKELEYEIMTGKLSKGSTYLTTMHHRQTPMRILYGQSDAGPVWVSEAYYHSELTDNPLEVVEIADSVNVKATYVAGQMKDAPHPEAAKAFMEFLTSEKGQQIYQKYGFMSVE